MKNQLFSIFIFIISPFVLLSQGIDHPLVKSGLQYQQAGKYKKAIVDFSSFIKSQSNTESVVFRHRGYSYYYLKQYDSAISDFKKADELAPGKTDALFALGKIAYQFGDFTNSLNYFNQEINYHPENSRALNDRGMVKCKVRDYDHALDDFLSAIALDSVFAMAYNNAGAAFYYNQDVDNPIKEDIISAKEYFSQAIDLDPTLSIAYRNRGAMNLFLGIYDEALIDLNIAGKLQPNAAIIPFYKGIVLEESGSPMAAIVELKKAIDINEYFPYAYEELGDIYKEKEQYESAKSYYKQAVSVTANKHGIYKGLMYYKLALIHAEEGETSKMYQKLIVAKKLNAFSDKKVYQRFLKAEEFKKYRAEKKFRKFTKAVTKLKKEYKFLHSELRWFRMNE